MENEYYKKIMKERYEEFQKYVKENKYDEAMLLSLENPDLKKEFNREDLTYLLKGYENKTLEAMVKRLKTLKENKSEYQQFLDDNII